jgi:hypothetical protein
MKIFLAARHERRWEMLRVASRLERDGHEVTSRWISGGGDNDPAIIPAVEDLLDLGRADCLVSFTDEPNSIVGGAARGERHVAFGIALGAGKRVYIVGPRENIFHHLFAVERYATVAELVAGLKGK